MEKKRKTGSSNYQDNLKNKKIRFDSAKLNKDYPKKSRQETSGIRLNKFIANTGLCSRREADNYIQSGDVKVNGKKITELGTKVSFNDEVKYKGKKLVPEKKVYILLNKPKDVITTTDDPQGRKTVLSLIKKGPEERIYPVGRLDRMSTGVLLLTNDGPLTKKLTHPKYQKKKIYQVSLEGDLTQKDLVQLSEGITLDDGFIKPDAISYILPEDKREIGVEIHSGKNRVIRRMLEHLGYKVIRLDRVYFAGLTKKGLPRGRWRHLTNKELSIIKKGSYE